MSRRTLIVLAVPLLAGIAAVLVFLRDPAPSAPATESEAESSTSMTEGSVKSGDTGAETFHPEASLSALSEKPYNGRDLTLGRVQDDNAAYTRYTISYLSGDLRISGIMNIPKGDGPFPVLILNHGYIDRSVYTNGRGLRREQDYLARRGFAVLHTDYRCHAESDCENPNDILLRLGYVEDAINAVEAVRASKLPQLDASRIGMLGHSMGGGVTQNVLVAQPGLLDAAVLFAPVSSDIRDSVERWTSRRPAEMKIITDTYGTPAENPQFWDDLSARTFFDRVTAPVSIHHGSADESVPLVWSETTRDALVALGKEVTLDVYPGQPHEFTTSWGQVMERTTAFFQAHLQS